MATVATIFTLNVKIKAATYLRTKVQSFAKGLVQFAANQ